MNLRDALTLAHERETDLVEVAPNSEPPVCRLLDYGKFKYAQTKKERESRKGQKSTELREVRFRPTTGAHDLETKTRTIQKLLAEGSKVKVSVVFRGRAITHPELGVGLLKRVSEGVQEQAKLERAPAMEGRMLSIILTPGVSAAGRPDGASGEKPAPAEEGQARQGLTDGPEKVKNAQA
jgi:translation initiation factor IF-3